MRVLFKTTSDHQQLGKGSVSFIQRQKNEPFFYFRASWTIAASLCWWSSAGRLFLGRTFAWNDLAVPSGSHHIINFNNKKIRERTRSLRFCLFMRLHFSLSPSQPLWSTEGTGGEKFFQHLFIIFFSLIYFLKPNPEDFNGLLSSAGSRNYGRLMDWRWMGLLLLLSFVFFFFLSCLLFPFYFPQSARWFFTHNVFGCFV